MVVPGLTVCTSSACAVRVCPARARPHATATTPTRATTPGCSVVRNIVARSVLDTRVTRLTHNADGSPTDEHVLDAGFRHSGRAGVGFARQLDDADLCPSRLQPGGGHSRVG